MTCTSNPDFDKNTEARTVAAAFPEAIRGRTILITGVNRQGIGYATAEAFASQFPKHLILAGRSSVKIQECIDALHALYPTINVRALLIDLSSQGSIRAAADEVLSWSDVPIIDILVNNAAVMRHGTSWEGEIPESKDGIEEMFAVNYLGHFLLTNLIMSKVLAASKTSSAGSTRIINLSSSGTWVSPFRASDIAWQKIVSQLPENERPQVAMMQMAGLVVNEDATYMPTAAYCQSKTCQILFSVILNEQLFEKHGILSLALNPGEIRTEIGRHTDRDWLAKAVEKREKMGIHHWKTQSQGASTTMVAACDPQLTLPERDGTGYYLDNCQIGKGPVYATDRTQARKMWDISETLVGQSFSW